ncbi:hypothetical protein C8R46DRAFT_826347, partial [Mycena filopes]
FPLLPWLHSSEACEHVFGESRRIVKDFTMLDFLYMIPKLRVKIRSAVLRAKASDSKAQAAGYSHTYFDNTGLDILALSSFPSDDDINLAAAEAAEESDSLIALLGLAPSQLHVGIAPAAPTLPGISSWYDAEDNEEEDTDSDVDSVSEAQQLQDLLDKAEHCSHFFCFSHTSDGNEDEILDELVAAEHSNIQTLVDAIPILSITEAAKPFGRGALTSDAIDFDYLVELRRRHQTVQAARGVRTRVVDRSSDKAKDASLRQQLIKKLHLALKEEQDHAIGTGLDRNARWHAPAPGGRGASGPGATLPAGNSANAALTATAAAKTAATKRKTVFTKAGVPNLAEVANARVTVFRPIRIGDYGVVLTTRGLMVGRVFEMHSKGGGKYGNHQPVTDSANISALSKISVQIFEKLHGTQFRSIPTATAILQTKQFAHILPINFL